MLGAASPVAPGGNSNVGPETAFSFDRDSAVGPSRGSSGYFTESEVQIVNLVAQ